MIKKIAIFLTITTSYVARAQNDLDAMRYSQTQSYGDARFMAMGGAFGSLGANVSCMNYNPAGIALYHKGELVFTPGFQLQSANATHYGNQTSDFSPKLNISNIGFVAAWDQTNQMRQQRQSQNPYQQYKNQNQPQQQNSQSSGRNAFGISYNRLADFNNHTTIEGYAPAGSSITNSMASAANGYTPDNLDQFYEGLGYQTYLINPVDAQGYPDSTSTHYASAVGANTMLKQTKANQTSGRVGELVFAFAHSFSDKFYLGGTIGVPMIKYNYQSTYTESDYKHTDSVFSSLQYQENVVTTGTGVNLKLGGIYRVNAGLKLGLYGQTATIYKMTDNYQNTMYSTFTDAYSYLNSNYQSPAGTYVYHLQTPGKIGGSISYVAGKLLAFSVDGEYINYGNAKFSDAAGSFNDVNHTIQTKYTGTANLKAGIEFNVRPVILRAGFASYGSPFGEVLSGNQVRNSFTGGVGFRGSHNVYLDLGFAYTKWTEKYYIIDPTYVSPSSISNSVIYITATLGIKFN